MSARILIREQEGQRQSLEASPERGWRVLGWFGLLLFLIGLGDALINWYPMAWSSPEWEFGTIATTFGSLPLITMGVAGMLGSFLARGIRWGGLTVGVLVLLMGLVVLGLYVLFLLDVPLALKASAGTPAGLAIRRGIARTTVLGMGFGVGYLAAAVVSLLSLKRRARL